MRPERRRRGNPVPLRRHRGRGVGLVLGAGGVLGAAWMTGALAAVQARLPFPVSEADVLVGTSAGSVLAAMLYAGLGTDELVAHQRGTSRGVLGGLGTPDLGCRACPPWPLWPVGSPRLVWRGLRTPGTVHPWVLAAACLPRGRAEHTALRALAEGLPATHRAGSQMWLTAVDYDSGRRVAFGRADAPPASVPDAVVASCSVPGWYRPTVIGTRRYIDGGVCSGTNADLLAPAGLAEVYILAPAASLVPDSRRGPAARLERYVRRLMTGALLREAAMLRDSGTKVTILTPGPDDLAAMGGNLMNPRRRVEVFETSLITSAAALAEAPLGMHRAGNPPQLPDLGEADYPRAASRFVAATISRPPGAAVR